VGGVRLWVFILSLCYFEEKEWTFLTERFRGALHISILSREFTIFFWFLHICWICTLCHVTEGVCSSMVFAVLAWLRLWAVFSVNRYRIDTCRMNLFILPILHRRIAGHLCHRFPIPKALHTVDNISTCLLGLVHDGRNYSICNGPATLGFNRAMSVISWVIERNSIIMKKVEMYLRNLLKQFMGSTIGNS